jgi:hypothetical protein
LYCVPNFLSQHHSCKESIHILIIEEGGEKEEEEEGERERERERPLSSATLMAMDVAATRRG